MSTSPTVVPKLRGGDELTTRTQDNTDIVLRPLAVALSRTPIMGAPAPAWVNFSLAPGFTNFGQGFAVSAYHRDALLYVHVKGFLSHAAGCVAFTTIATLPQGYRVLEVRRFPVEGNGSTYQAVQLNTDGALKNCVAIAAGGYMGLELSFLAEA